MRCNDPSSFLANIVCFGPLRIVISLTVLNRSVRDRFPHLYKECFILFSNRCGISQSTPSRVQRCSISWISNKWNWINYGNNAMNNFPHVLWKGHDTKPHSFCAYTTFSKLDIEFCSFSPFIHNKKSRRTQ